jgi:Beta-fructosidases (levanase/invertase)
MNDFRPKFHFSAPKGWLNDPNGLCFFKGGFHLFYQHNPYAPRWGPMHWGHARTLDFVNWERLPVALSPDTKNDNFLGCFSGSALERSGELYLMYTGTPFLKQHQLIARSADGISFTKIKEPAVPINKRPPRSGRLNFRDPKMFIYGDKICAVIGASYKKGRQIALYKSDDLKSFEYAGSILREESPACGIFECPDLILGGEADILIYSVMNTAPATQNLHSSVFIPGKFDGASFKPFSTPKELDFGADFYAPQTVKTPERTLLVAWMGMWGRTIPAAYLGKGYAGIMTMPREIEYRGGVLRQKPAAEIYKYFKERAKFKGIINKETEIDGVEGNSGLLKIKAKYDSSFKVKIFKGEKCETVISYDRGTITFDRSRGGYKIQGNKREKDCSVRSGAVPKGEFAELEIFPDVSAVEIFANGSFAMANAVYPFENSTGITFSSEKGTEINISYLEATFTASAAY